MVDGVPWVGCGVNGGLLDGGLGIVLRFIIYWLLKGSGDGSECGYEGDIPAGDMLSTLH
jgi:hypothetical protein